MAEDEGELSDRRHFHYLSDPPGSFVLIAPAETVETAVVFVHGFGGDAAGTWSQFQQFADDHPDFAECFSGVDLYFLQYQAVWESIGSSVDTLAAIITNVVFHPESPQFQVQLGPLGVGIETPTAELSGDRNADSEQRPRSTNALRTRAVRISWVSDQSQSPPAR